MSTMRASRAVTGWVGWIWFAAVVMIMNGTFNAIDGLVALLKDEVYVQTKKGLVVFDYTAWGWILLIIGAIQLIVGFALASGQFWARVMAIFLATLSAIAQIAFITAFPLWSLIVITLDVIVLWALIVHGEEAETAART
jgi:hypothetical protein